MKHKKLQDVLPKLCQIMAKDFTDFRDDWENVVEAYAEVFQYLNEVSQWKSWDLEDLAVQIIERYIEKREKGFRGDECFPAYDWLAHEFYELIWELGENVYDPEEDDL
jgi:hypothetical protein